jgi:hypothetical protein
VVANSHGLGFTHDRLATVEQKTVLRLAQPIRTTTTKRGIVQRAVQRTAHCVHAVNALHGLASFFRGNKPNRHVNATNHQHALLRFDLTCNIGGQPAVACIDFARLQRAAKGAEHSPSGCGNHVIDGRCVRLDERRRVDFVVFRNCPVHAERYRLRFAREVGNSERPSSPFETHLRCVHNS